jgi:excinuclease UvrABC nuclease subunit
VLARAFGLRTCAGRLRPQADFPACFHGQIGVCSSPCDGAVNAADYAQRVAALLAFFAGEPGALAALEARRDALAAGEHFEAAARQQREIEFAERLRRRQQQLGWVVERQHFAVLQPGAGNRGLVVYIVTHGRLVERAHLVAQDTLPELVARVQTRLATKEAPALRAEEVDGTTILAAWLRDRGERDGYVLPIAQCTSEAESDSAASPPGRLPEWAAALRALLQPGASPNGAASLAAAGEDEQCRRQQDQPQVAQ